MTGISDPLMGHALDRRYEITARLARGGMATVYRATDTRLDREVAVKVMHSGLGDDAEFAAKFDREARAAARLSHPNVVSVFDQGLDQGRPYIVMECVEGCTLRTVLSREAPLDPIRALDLLEPVLAALAAAHEAGLVHRDVKPENVLISDRGQIKVADFGLAKAVTAQSSTATAGLLIGTVSYLPPELVTTGKADARSDVYSAGVVLYELLTGTKPHVGETPIQVAYAHVHNDVSPPSALRPEIPDYLDALVRGATSRDREQRPHDARVFLTRLRRVRSALRDGVDTDVELTIDLTPGLAHTTILDPDELAAAEEAGRSSSGRSRTPPGFATVPAPTQRATAASAPPPMLPRSRPTPVENSEEWVENSEEWVENSEEPDFEVVADDPAARSLRRRRRRGWIALLVVLLLAGLAAYGGWYLTEGRFTTAPALTNLTENEALSTAREAGLSVDFGSDFSEEVAKGAVISTDPSAGAEIAQGGTVHAVLSKGPERYPVPELVGLEQAAAQSALTDGHLAVGTVKEAWHEKTAAGKVTKASVAEGEQVKPDTEVDLTVSKGPKPIKINDYSGESADTAKAALTEAGFSVTVSTEHSDSVKAGRVISQTPNKGNGRAGDKVTLVQSLGPVLVTVPNVKAMGVDSATKTLDDAGFEVVTKNDENLHLGLGYVSRSDPKGGTEAPKGSKVTLYLV